MKPQGSSERLDRGLSSVPLQSSASALPPWLPGWVFRLDMPMWICDPSGVLVHLNTQAGTLLGVAEWIGRRCHMLVRGTDKEGHPFCRADCAVRARARGGGSLRPLTMRFRSDTDDPAWSIVIVVPVDPPEGGDPWLVHCAVDLSREHELEEYLVAVASRSLGDRTGETELTPREREILGLLARDVDAHAIARRLHIGYVTVRNHIRHLLKKLRVHSIEEAVARHLLLPGERPGEPGAIRDSST